MADARFRRRTTLCVEEYRAAGKAECAGHIAIAWHHRNWREVVDQLLRLALALIANSTCRLALGNNDRSNISAFVPMALSPDLRAFFDPHAD